MTSPIDFNLNEGSPLCEKNRFNSKEIKGFSLLKFLILKDLDKAVENS